MKLRAALPLAAVLFFLSGALGLGYQLVWVQRAALVVGASQIALSTVLTSFFLVPTFFMGGTLPLLLDGLVQRDESIGSLTSFLYGLNILAEKIEDRPQNTTRFLVIAREKAKRAKHNKTSIMFSIKDEAGSLLKVLQLFGRNGINLSKIQSRPLRNRPWEYLFYVDFDGHIEDPKVEKVVHTIMKRCMFFRVLGSYPRSRRQ